MMFLRFRKSVTLIELLIATALLSTMIIGINNLGIFSRSQLVTTLRRSIVQNNVSRCLEHMSKHISQAIGNSAISGGDPVAITASSVSAFVDTNGNGASEAGAGDYWIRYKFDPNAYTLSYCNQCDDSACASCSGTEEVVASRITAFSASKDFSKGNYVTAGVTACWDPAADCSNNPNNPSIDMATSIHLHAVSTN